MAIEDNPKKRIATYKKDKSDEQGEKTSPIFIGLAEGGGFEPPVRLPVRQFSKLLVSATHPSFPLQKITDCNETISFQYEHSEFVFQKCGAKLLLFFYLSK